MSDFEKFEWMVFIAVFIFSLVVWQLWGFVSHCIFVWPIRWDASICWNGQVQSAVQKAAENAYNFLP